MSTKYVINKCFGGFGVSDKVFEYLLNNKGWKLVDLDDRGYTTLSEEEQQNAIYKGKGQGIFGGYRFLARSYTLEFRANPDLIEAIEAIGLKEASGRYANLDIVSAPYKPEENMLEIDEYDGNETLQSIPVRY